MHEYLRLITFLKNISLFHLLPFGLGLALCVLLLNNGAGMPPATTANRFSANTLNTFHNFDKFYPYDISNESALAVALKTRVPVLFGSSELTSHHLPGISYRFFCTQPNDRFLAVGHAGFQCMAILTTLAANRPVLKDARITIILSPGWFEKQYASGTSLTSFFEFCPPDYLYQIYRDDSLDSHTRNHLENYIGRNYDKITKPNALLRTMGRDKSLPLHAVFNYPFGMADEAEIRLQETRDFYLTAQHRLMLQLAAAENHPYQFRNRTVNWDSLFDASERNFAQISASNRMGVEDSYYTAWLKDRPKKHMTAVDAHINQEYKDLEALVYFLRANNINPLFVVMPLNPLAHENLEELDPTMKKVSEMLTANDYRVLDMYNENRVAYRKGVLEDIMHPHDLGWYQIDRFILEHYHD